MKIGLWGSYNYGNYGDDVMAIIFSNMIKEMGHTPCVYRLNKELASIYNINTADTVNELFDNSSAILIGGGGMLVPGSRVRSIFRKTARSFENDFLKFSDKMNQYMIPVFAASIGGDGGGVNTYLPSARLKVFRNHCFKGASVRLSSDEKLLKSLGISSECYPDVILGVNSLLGVKNNNSENNRIKIGLNLTGSSGHKLAVKLLELGKEFDVELVFILSHLEEYGMKYEIVPPLVENNVKIYNYRDPVDMLKTIGSLDLLISSKLHLGVSALSLNVPFISFNGKNKTKTLFQQLGLTRYLYNSNDQARLIQEIKQYISGELKINYSFSETNIAKNKSLGHLSYVKKMINNL
ncbi:MAG: polysaccharide pyruvyl transferase family protein [Candidatus Thiodiazotropha sp. (ex Codakia rugifera)]|nr:polysaccharide pyruvyl transferase family protein [Candidatus Thiodiazotropha sp. (ex Codakia rugifera)]